MLKLIERTLAAGLKHHRDNPVRVYEDDLQGDRIVRARRFVLKNLAELRGDESDKVLRVIELGCGTADISGPFAAKDFVYGIDCAAVQLEKARERFPRMVTREIPLEDLAPTACDVLVLCETLEHLDDPHELVKRWLPLAETCVISHPLDELKNNQHSGGDHCWSLSRGDFSAWFTIGGHEVVEATEFPMGNYNIKLGRGKKKMEEA